VEYQGTAVRLALTVASGEDASIVLPDDLFFANPVQPGEAAVMAWREQDAHRLADSQTTGP
jgi:putative spermidine/putrescine transport system ATP-binding protein